MPSGTPHATSIERAMAVLELLDSSERPWNISEIARKLRIPKSTTHVIVTTLDRLGYLKHEPNARAYSLGLKVYGLGQDMMKKLALPEIALPQMRLLSERTKLTVHLALRDHDQAIYIQKVDGPGLIRFDTYVGKRTNLHCTAVGKILLAWAPEETLQSALTRRSYTRHTRRTLASAGALRKELGVVRQQGYAIDDEEEELEVRCLAVPVFRQPDEVIAALGVSGTIGQIRQENMKPVLVAMKHAASAIYGAVKPPADSRS